MPALDGANQSVPEGAPESGEDDEEDFRAIAETSFHLGWRICSSKVHVLISTTVLLTGRARHTFRLLIERSQPCVLWGVVVRVSLSGAVVDRYFGSVRRGGIVAWPPLRGRACDV